MLYTFYACRPDGGATTFEAVMLAGDAEAARQAWRVLDEHASCSHVEVWEADRVVATTHRSRQAGGG